MWAGTPHRVHVKINPPNNFTKNFFCLSSYPHCSHFCFIPISAAFGCLMPAPHLAAHHLPDAAVVVVVIAIAATVAIALSIDVVAAANNSSTAACS